MTDRKRLSKFLSLMLRHQPAKFDLQLDEQGFVALETVWQRVQTHFNGDVTLEDVLEVATQPSADGKQRFEVVGNRIRARYGHSAVTTITYPPAEPPEFLYHGTTPAALEAIRREGLKPQHRQYVHLSLDPSWAATVGQRRAKTPVVLRIRAGAMYAAGHEFHHPEPKHYLTASVPVAFIEFP